MGNRLTAIAFALALSACSSTPSVYYAQTPASGHANQTYQAGTAAAQGPFRPNANLFVCNNISISNRPITNGSGKIKNFSPMVVANGIALATAPANDVCMTSGFGPRYGRMHKGIDLQSRPAGTVYSAAPGRVLEVSLQSGFGNQVVIEHGNGVYTRYAHLSRFSANLRPGQKIGFGQPLGTMGATGNATAIHLHYEILLGNYNNPKRSYGLEARNPLSFPAWQGLS